MQVESIAECSRGAFCNTFDLHYAIIGLDKTNNFLSFVGWPLKTGFTTIKFNGYPIREVKKIFFSDRPIPVKQGRVRGNRNIFKAA